MCLTCGCGGDEDPSSHGSHEREGGGAQVIRAHTHEHHEHGEVGASLHGDGENGRRIRLEQDLLEKNDRLARQNRERFRREGMLVLNLVSGPGSGKTTLLERILRELSGEMPLGVIEGDQTTTLDADRISATGTPAVQINTGRVCHLDAHMVAHAADSLPSLAGGVLFIENVGNLVCPSSFDLGETLRVVLLSVTEGEDKPLKYPYLFEGAPVALLTKTDLSPHTGFDTALCASNLRRVRPDVRLFELSSRTGEGFPAWIDWIRQEARSVRDRIPDAVSS